jgi:hypothetical protein
MDNSFQTSFIPKAPVVGTTSIPTRSTKSLFSVITFIFLILVILSAVGLFFYKNYLLSKIETLSASLVRAEGYFDQETISELDLYSKRSAVAKTVLNNHIIISPLFSLLAEITIPSIQYTSFDHKNSGDVFSVNISGIARDYRSVAIQAEVFNGAKGRYLKNVVFSNLNRDKNGYITFNLTFDVDKALFSYQDNSVLQSKTNPQEAPKQKTVDNISNANSTVNASSTSLLNSAPANTTTPSTSSSTNINKLQN